jgi:hypothetical protein
MLKYVSVFSLYVAAVAVLSAPVWSSQSKAFNFDGKDWARQGQAWDAFVNEMWAKHRPELQAPTDGWKKNHDDAYYRTAIVE